MKIQKFCLVIILLLFISWKGYAQYTAIEGKILDYDQNSKDTIVTICTEPLGLIGQNCIDLPVNKKGAFRHEFTVLRLSEIIFCFSKNYIKILLEPKQEVYIEFKAKEFLNSRRIPKNIKISGENSETDKIVIDYSSKFKEHFYYHYFIGNKIMLDELVYDYEKYYEYRTIYFNKETEFLTNYIEINKIKDRTFIEWADAKRLYDYGRDLYQFHFATSNPLIDPIPDWYVKKMEEIIPLNKRGATNGNDYSNYLEYKKMIMSRAFEMSEEGKQLIKNKQSVGEAKLKYVLKHTDGIGKDIILGQFISDFVDQGVRVGTEITKYIDKIEDESIRNTVREFVNQKKKGRGANGEL